ncbi:amidohydrolase [Streptomyces sp. ODS28]|uniref:amidohydrolase n=1 Tax=Streptomyces sp. ODS28 TaxID=3136688 RepID=UPI0031EC74C0
MTSTAPDATTPVPHLDHWLDVYRDLHAHPELAFAERRTAAAVARELAASPGWEVTEGVGGTGVVGVLRNGPGPVVLLRADMDGLPVEERTDLPYSSAESGRMHACGHDVHVTCLLAACRELAERPGTWSGTVVAVFQPAEEIGQGARAMLDDGLLDRFPHPDVCLGQHVGPLPAGVVISRPGLLMAAADSLRVTLYGAGGHASTPQQAVDPIVLASAVVLRLQTYAARQAPRSPAPVLTPGSLHSGSAANIIPHTAELLLSLRTYDEETRAEALEEVRRIIRCEAEASGAPRPPEVEAYDGFPLTLNSPQATSLVLRALEGTGAPVQELAAPLGGSEDFGLLGAAAACPSVFWHFGGAGWDTYTPEDLDRLRGGTLPPRIPSNHSPYFAPDPEPTLEAGIRDLLAASAVYLAPQETSAAPGT